VDILRALWDAEILDDPETLTSILMIHLSSCRYRPPPPGFLHRWDCCRPYRTSLLPRIYNRSSHRFSLLLDELLMGKLPWCEVSTGAPLFVRLNALILDKNW